MRLSPLAALAFLAAGARAQFPDAGPDQSLVYPAVATLAGNVVDGTPLDYWTADGNGITENYMIKYSSTSGTTAVGPLQTSSGGIYGFPADLIRIGTRVYGLDATRRQIYILNASTGIVSPVGSPWSATYASVESLAHNPAADRLYAVDHATDQLLLIDRATGVPTPIGFQTLSAWTEIRSLAWRDSDSSLYAVDQATDSLIRIDPATGIATFVVSLAAETDARIEELVFHGAELYAMHSYHLTSGSLISTELHEIDLSDGSARTIGPPLPDVSAHSLIVNSVPEPILWSKVSGPGSVAFGDPEALDSTATLSAPGSYVLRLTVETSGGPVSDDVTIVEDGCPSDPNKVEPGVCGCGVPDDDADGDLYADCVDNCPAVANSDQFDTDQEGVGDACDNCLTIPNPGQGDCDGDLLGDACEIAAGEPDCNRNEVPDGCDVSSGASTDFDANLVPDECQSPSGSVFCFGDGSGTACPCGNSVPPGTQTGCANSTGAGAAIVGSGTPQVSADTFVLSASGTPPNVLGVIFQGKSNVAGGAGTPFADGLRCVSIGLLRITTRAATPAGTLDYPQLGDPAVSVRGQVPAIGGLRYYQLTYRNAAGPCGGFLNNTNGLAVVWAP